MTPAPSMEEREKGGMGEREKSCRIALCKTSPALPLSRSPFLILLLSILILFGCEEDLTLVEETGRAFTLYGVLNPHADTQFVHVFPIEGTLEHASPEPLAARFTSTDLVSGETRVWADSVIRDQWGQYGHVFWAPFRVAYDHAYRLEVVGAEGEASRVDVAVPPRVRDVLGEPEVWRGSVLVPLRLEGAAPHLAQVTVHFWGRGIEGFEGISPIYYLGEVTLPYSGRLQETPEGWVVPVDLREGYGVLYEEIVKEVPAEMLEQHGIDLLLITVDLIVASEAWNLPEGAADPLAQAHPEVMTNVENGYGFVGAGYRIRHQWRPPVEALQAAGFVPPR